MPNPKFKEKKFVSLTFEKQTSGCSFRQEEIQVVADLFTPIPMVFTRGSTDI